MRLLSCGGCELAQVVCDADDGPFGPHFLDTPQQELAECSRLFDLSEHRFDHLLAQSIAAAMASAPELGAHPGEERSGLEPPLGGGGGGSVLPPPSRDVAVDPPPAERAKIGSRAVTGVGRDFLRIALEIGLDGIEQRSKLRLIAPIGVEGVRHDDLRRRIDRGLRVVALDVAVFGLQNAAVRIGEVALALAVGLILGWRRRGNSVCEAIMMEGKGVSYGYRERPAGRLVPARPFFIGNPGWARSNA